MLFQFLKYLRPTHYFQLLRNDGSSIFPNVEQIPNSILSQILTDSNYESETSKEYDISYQAILGGYNGNAETYSTFKNIPIVDEYRFLRKNFNKFWVFYVLILRLITFKNPIKEISAFKKSAYKIQSRIEQVPLKINSYSTYKSTLISQLPFVSVIIPTLNRYEYLKDVLLDLEKQDYDNFEVIVIDQSKPFQKEFYSGYDLKLEIVEQQEKALWLARNHGIKIAKGDYILLFDDDSRVDSNWISEHLKCLDYFNADISSGTSISTVGAAVPHNYSFFRISDQLDTGNVLVPKKIFRSIGLFDRQFENQRMGDGEFGLRAYLAGYKNISNPNAQRLHLKVGSGGLREMGSWDAFRTQKLFAPRPIPSVLYLFRKYYGNKAAFLTLLKTVPPSIIPYKYKKNKKMLALGVAISLFLFPLILMQVLLSWRRASVKLKQGNRIGKLE